MPEPRHPRALIPASRYTSAEWAARENARLWPRVWLFAGLGSDVLHPGERLVLDVGTQSAVVVRGDDGRLRAFHNVCRHRGARLCENGEGHARTLRCPYHHWTWKTDGKLLSWPDGTHFADPPGDVALLEVACEERHAAIWVCLGQPAVPIDAFLAPVADTLQRFRLDRWVRSDDISLAVAANWKTSADVSNESYHIRTLHPEVLPLVNDVAVPVEPLGPHTRMVAHFGAPSPHMPASAPFDETMRAWQQSLGLDPPLDPRAPHLRERLQKALRALGQARRMPWDMLMDAELLANTQLNLFPNTQLNLYAHRIQVYRHRPEGQDPGQMVFDQIAYRPLADDEIRPALPPPKIGDARTAAQGSMMAADLAMVLRLQRGMASAACDGLRLTAEEQAIAHLHAALDEWMADA